MTERVKQPRLAYWLGGLTLCFVLVRALYIAAGVRFNDRTLIEVMHFIDPALLKSQLLESVWYLHIQPPLFNLFVGLVLKVTPESPGLFCAIYLACGLCLYLNTFLLQVKLGVGHRLAALLSTVFMASPSYILWEQFLMYTMPVATLISIAALSLVCYVEQRRGWQLGIFFLAVFLLCGMRSMFHIGYFVLMFGLLLACLKGYRRHVIRWGLVPLVVLFGFYLKNYLLFGEFNVCSFTEKNLWIMTAGSMPWDEKTALVESGELSELSLVNRWASLDAYPPEYKEVPDRFSEIPALSETHKSTGAVNYNHYGYIANCNRYGEDASYVLWNQPRHFLIATTLSWYRYFKSSSALPVSPANQDRIRPMIRFYDHIIYGKLPIDLAPYSRVVRLTQTPPYIFLLFGLPLVLGFAVYRALRPAGIASTTAQRSLLLFLAFNIFMVAALGCTFDVLETSRYRFTTDGLSVVLLGFLITQVLRKWHRRDRSARSVAS